MGIEYSTGNPQDVKQIRELRAGIVNLTMCAGIEYKVVDDLLMHAEVEVDQILPILRDLNPQTQGIRRKIFNRLLGQPPVEILAMSPRVIRYQWPDHVEAHRGRQMQKIRGILIKSIESNLSHDDNRSELLIGAVKSVFPSKNELKNSDTMTP